MATQPKAQQQVRLPRGTLDRATVVAAALELADREGLGGVTMARVAAELGASTMSLYRHVHDKQELLEAIVEYALAEIPVVTKDNRPWRVRLEENAVLVREATLRHPAMIEVVLSQDVYGPAAMQFGLETMALLQEAGFDEDSAIRGFMALRNHMIGALAWEISRFRHGGGEFHRHEVESFVRRDTPADSPLWHFGQVVADDPEAQFMFGVRRLLDGFEAELRRSKKKSG
jgi:AcrR family transcriptional regulator